MLRLLTRGESCLPLRRSRKQHSARVSRENTMAVPATAMTTMAQVGSEVPEPAGLPAAGRPRQRQPRCRQ